MALSLLTMRFWRNGQNNLIHHFYMTIPGYKDGPNPAESPYLTLIADE